MTGYTCECGHPSVEHDRITTRTVIESAVHGLLPGGALLSTEYPCLTPGCPCTSVHRSPGGRS